MWDQGIDSLSLTQKQQVIEIIITIVCAVGPALLSQAKDSNKKKRSKYVAQSGSRLVSYSNASPTTRISQSNTTEMTFHGMDPNGPLTYDEKEMLQFLLAKKRRFEESRFFR